MWETWRPESFPVLQILLQRTKILMIIFMNEEYNDHRYVDISNFISYCVFVCCEVQFLNRLFYLYLFQSVWKSIMKCI